MSNHHQLNQSQHFPTKRADPFPFLTLLDLHRATNDFSLISFCQSTKLDIDTGNAQAFEGQWQPQVLVASSRQARAPKAGPSIWDFSSTIGSHSAQMLTPTTTNNKVYQQHANLAPKFALEPPSLVEYSNSTGTVISCRPQQQFLSSSAPIAAGSSAPPNINNKNIKTMMSLGSPISISWRIVKQQHGNELSSDNSEEEDSFDLIETENNNSLVVGVSQAGSKNQQQQAFVRQDGSLVIQPFKATDYRRDVHSSVYRCCLENRFGSLCSRPVRTRAGK